MYDDKSAMQELKRMTLMWTSAGMNNQVMLAL